MKKISLLLFICLVSGAVLSAEEMSAEQWLQYNETVTTMFEELADAVRNGEEPPIKCATPILNALISSQPKGVDSKAAYYEREDTMSYTYSTNHFLLHYTGTGANRIYQFDVQDSMAGVPNYIFEAGKICDSVWEHTVGDLGYPPPISDGYYNGGGNGLLDIYFVHFPAYGATVRDSVQATIPLTMTTYMFIENDYEGFPGYEMNRLNALRVSLAHEFFHTVQFGIDASELEGSSPDFNPAWIEMSAVFMEEEHYDDIDDYINYLLYFYDVPQWSIRTGTVLGSPTINYWRNLHMYASVIFPIFLAERYGSVIVRDIWEGCGEVSGPNWWLAADDAIKSRSGDTSDLKSEFQEFALWNLFTKHRFKSGDYFPEAINYDTVNLAARIIDYPTTVALGDSITPDNLGANYIMLENVDLMSLGIKIEFEPETADSWGITLVGMQDDIGQPVVVEHIDYDTVTSVIQIPDAADFDKIALILSVLGGNAKQVGYSLTVSTMGDGVLRPNAGDTVDAGREFVIRWSLVDAGDSVKIEFSDDNGATWSNVVNSTANNGQYPWPVPNIESDFCLIRISDVENPGIMVQNEGVFSISATGLIFGEPFPNPAWIQNDELITFPVNYQSSDRGQIDWSVTILTLAGEMVQRIEGRGVELTINDTRVSAHQWDYTNEGGELVAAGPYLAVIKFKDEKQIKKFVVLR